MLEKEAVIEAEEFGLPEQELDEVRRMLRREMWIEMCALKEACSVPRGHKRKWGVEVEGGF